MLISQYCGEVNNMLQSTRSVQHLPLFSWTEWFGTKWGNGEEEALSEHSNHEGGDERTATGRERTRKWEPVCEGEGKEEAEADNSCDFDLHYLLVISVEIPHDFSAESHDFLHLLALRKCN